MNMAMFQESTAVHPEFGSAAIFIGIIGLLIIAFSRESGTMMLGILISVLAPVLLQEDYHKEVEKQFVLESFDKGETIECTLYRGEHIRLSPSRGWHREGERFIKADQVFSDPLLCSVLTKEPPKPILWVVWIFYGLYVLIAFSGRAWMSDRRKNEEAENIKGLDHD
ncbi:hypothetical protein [Sulfuricurvum sp.]|uniref:hypothetical protein n=1 Tax=Sulfuricurvum sp. TaxID=2025608 RepID=UPI00260DE183|nr:hypothetical protein [Sulfuricurvum sp.]MDD3595775.1 hypothetical protein [Sulfuricurvum sp.]